MEKRDAIALAIEKQYGDGHHSFELREAISAAILKAREDAFEEAAKIADEYVWDAHALAQATDIGRAVHYQSVEIASAIRQHSQKGEK